MKKLFFLWLIVLALLMSSCTTQMTTSILKKYEPLPEQTEVLLLGAEDPLPERSDLIGDLKVSNALVSGNCDLAATFEKIKPKVLQAGGNAIKIRKYQLNENACPTFEAYMLRAEDPEDYLFPNLPENADHALLHLYRTNGAGWAVKYDLYMDENILARVSNNWRETVKLEKEEGEHLLSAKTETKAEMPLNIEFGKEYYVRNSIASGFFVGRPQLTLMDSKFGRVEFQSVATQVNHSTVNDTSVKALPAFKRFQFTVSGGWGYRLARVAEGIAPEERAVIEQLRSGYQFEVSASYFFVEQVGFGLRYNHFFSSAEGDGYLVRPGQNPQFGKATFKDRINFFGAVFNLRFFSKKRNCFSIDYALGYTGYLQKQTWITIPGSVKGNAVGSLLSLGYDFPISGTTSLGLQVALVGGALSKYTQTLDGITETIRLKDGQQEGLGKVHLSVALRF